MKENTILTDSNVAALTLDELARLGAQEMIRMALNAEISVYLQRVRELKAADGKPSIVRNGYHDKREIAIGSGLAEVSVPRTRNRSGGQENFVSSIIPPYMRRSPKISEIIPLLYLRGLSNGDIQPILSKLFGKDTRGHSSANITRLKSVWSSEYKDWQRSDLSQKQYCYIWADGIHFNVRFSDNRICVLVVVGATADGKKELISVTSGYRESEESWGFVLRNLRERGMKSAKLAIGDGALGFWAALRSVYPECRTQRCWVHKTANVLDKLPRQIQSKAKSMLHDIYEAETRRKAEKAFDAFIHAFDGKYSKVAECMKKDRDSLLTFFDFPAYHWKHIRSTNPIESPFATVRLRTDKTRGHGSETTTLMMVFKLLEQASLRWHVLAGSKLIPLVLEGKIFEDGELKAAA